MVHFKVHVSFAAQLALPCGQPVHQTGLVQRIEVHQAEKVDGVWVQRLTIHYNCVGAITIPEDLPLPMPDITVNTRKGVYVSYQPDSKAG